MRATLILDKSTRITANIPDHQAFWLLGEFCGLVVGDDISPADIAVPKSIPSPPSNPPAKAPLPPAPVDQTSLLVYKCGNCQSNSVVKVPRSTAPGDPITCRCGAVIEIQTINKAFGDCPNCETTFHHMGMINGLKVLTCRNCQSPIDLCEKKDGTYGVLS